MPILRAGEEKVLKNILSYHVLARITQEWSAMLPDRNKVHHRTTKKSTHPYRHFKPCGCTNFTFPVVMINFEYVLS